MPSVSPVPTPLQPPVFARPKSDIYALIGVLAFIGLVVVGAAIFAWYDSASDGKFGDSAPLWVVIALSSALFVLPNLFAIWLMRHLRLAADDRGLWIRGVFRTRFIPWCDLEDYEFRPAPQAATAKLSWVCAGGKWRRLPQLYANMEALRARIQLEATQSRAQSWQLNVERDDTGDWPKTYAYRDPSGRLTFALAFAGLLVYFGFTFGRVFSADSLRTTRLIWENLDFWGRVGSVLMPLLVLGMFALWLLPMYAVMRAKKGLGAQIIRADCSALTLLDGDLQTDVAWGEISDYYLEDVKGPMTLHQYVVESAEARIVFRQEIANYSELTALISARAINAQSSDWRSREEADSDTLGGADTLWSGGAPGIGRKVYHYRTRTTRAMLFLGVFFNLVFLGGFISSSSWRERDISDLVAGAFLLPVSALTLGGALAFRRASIQTDESGVFQRGVWSERSLSWNQIKSFDFNGYFYSVKGQNAMIRYGIVAASENLQAEIEARTGLKMRRTDRSQNDE